MLVRTCVCVCVYQRGFGSPQAIIFGYSQEGCGCGGENSCTVGPERNWVIFGMMLGNRWKGKLRGGLLLNTHTYTHTHVIPEAQVGALNTISVVNFGLLPYTARNSSLPTTLFTPPFLLSSTELLYSHSNFLFFPSVAAPLILSHFSFTVSTHEFFFFSFQYLRMAWGVSPMMKVVCLVWCTLLLAKVTG